MKLSKVLKRFFFVFFSCFDRQKLFCSLILCDIIIIISGESRFESGANPFAIFFPSSKHLVRSSCFVVATFVYLINLTLKSPPFLKTFVNQNLIKSQRGYHEKITHKVCYTFKKVY